jgi:tetratricopeptide (TPR) repeat protein
MRSVQAVPSSCRLHRAATTALEAGWLATILLVPLAVNPWGFNYELPKVALFRGLVLLMAAVHVLILAWSPGRPDPSPSPSRSRSHGLHRPLVLAILLVAGTAILSTLTSPSPLLSLWGSYHRHQGAYLLLCFVLWALLLAAYLRTPAHRRRLATAVVVIGSAVAVTPFIEALRWHKNPFAWRPGGSLGNPIFLGAFLIMVIPFTLAGFISAFPRLLRGYQRAFFWGLALALQALALLVTQSRGPWVGALAGLALFIALAFWPTHRRVVLAGLVGGTLLIGGLTAGLNFGTAPSSRLSQLPYVRRVVLQQGVRSGTVRVRLVLWQAAREVITTWPEIGLEPDRWHALRPLLGYGPDTAAAVYNTVYPPELAHIEDPDAIWDRAHNETLDIVTMRGWLGLAALAVLGGACARRGLALCRAAADLAERVQVAAPLAALAARAVEAQFAFSVTATTMMAWLCVAWLASEQRTTGQGADGGSQIKSVLTDEGPGCSQYDSQPVQRSNTTARWRVYATVGALVLVLIAVYVEGGAAWADALVARARVLDQANQWGESIGLYDRALAVTPWRAAYYQLRAEAFYNLARALPQGETELQVQLLEAAGRSMARARRLEPLELEHYSNSGILYAYWSHTVDRRYLETAVAFYQKAFRLAPTRADLRVDLGHVYHNHSLYEEALGQYRTALEIDPQFAAAHYDSGLAWLALGQTEPARQAFQAALDLAPECGACREALDSLDE